MSAFKGTEAWVPITTQQMTTHQTDCSSSTRSHFWHIKPQIWWVMWLIHANPLQDMVTERDTVALHCTSVRICWHNKELIKKFETGACLLQKINDYVVYFMVKQNWRRPMRYNNNSADQYGSIEILHRSILINREEEKRLSLGNAR